MFYDSVTLQQFQRTSFDHATKIDLTPNSSLTLASGVLQADPIDSSI